MEYRPGQYFWHRCNRGRTDNFAKLPDQSLDARGLDLSRVTVRSVGSAENVLPVLEGLTNSK